MPNYFIQLLNKLICGVAFTLLMNSQLTAEATTPCANASDSNEVLTCGSASEIIAQLNKDVQKVYLLGGELVLSQPPLVKTPAIAVESPNLSSRKSTKIIEKELVRPPLRVDKKNTKNDTNLFNVVAVLDEKGTKHLSKCLGKLSEKNIDQHFPEFKEELKKIGEYSLIRAQHFNSLRDMLAKSPSKEQCISYLSFILMAS